MLDVSRRSPQGEAGCVPSNMTFLAVFPRGATFRIVRPHSLGSPGPSSSHNAKNGTSAPRGPFLHAVPVRMPGTSAALLPTHPELSDTSPRWEGGWKIRNSKSEIRNLCAPPAYNPPMTSHFTWILP